MLEPSKKTRQVVVVNALPPSKEGYVIKCSCGHYTSGPLLRGTATVAAAMHEMLGREHECTFTHCGTKQVFKLEES